MKKKLLCVFIIMLSICLISAAQADTQTVNLGDTGISFKVDKQYEMCLST